MAELNPRLVVLSISGFGHDGPEAGRAGYDQIAQGEAGLMSVTGSGPTDIQRVGVPIADLLAGMYGAFGVLAACRSASGRAVARWCVRRCWPRSSVCTLFRARSGRWRARSARRRVTTILRSARTACSRPPTAPYRSRSAARDCGNASAKASVSIPTRQVWLRTRSAWTTASASTRWCKPPSRCTPPTNCWRSSTESGCRPGEFARIREVYEWEQTPVAGSAHRRGPRHVGDHHVAWSAAAVLRPGRRRTHAPQAQRSAGARCRQ